MSPFSWERANWLGLRSCLVFPSCLCPFGSAAPRALSSRPLVAHSLEGSPNGKYKYMTLFPDFTWSFRNLPKQRAWGWGWGCVTQNIPWQSFFPSVPPSSSIQRQLLPSRPHTLLPLPLSAPSQKLSHVPDSSASPFFSSQPFSVPFFRLASPAVLHATCCPESATQKLVNISLSPLGEGGKTMWSYTIFFFLRIVFINFS